MGFLQIRFEITRGANITLPLSKTRENHARNLKFGT